MSGQRLCLRVDSDFRDLERLGVGLPRGQSRLLFFAGCENLFALILSLRAAVAHAMKARGHFVDDSGRHDCCGVGFVVCVKQT